MKNQLDKSPDFKKSLTLELKQLFLIFDEQSPRANLSTAESCTGGMLSSMITSIPGASQYFPGSIISYDNLIKIKLLQVTKQNLDQFGAVSKEVAIQMAQGIVDLMETTYGVAITGIAGPTGGSKEKPVGTVWIGIADREKKKSFAQKFLFQGDRQKIREQSCDQAIKLLRAYLIEGT